MCFPGYKFPRTYFPSVLCVPAHIYHRTVYIKDTASNCNFKFFRLLEEILIVFPVIKLFN